MTCFCRFDSKAHESFVHFAYTPYKPSQTPRQCDVPTKHAPTQLRTVRLHSVLFIVALQIISNSFCFKKVSLTTKYHGQLLDHELNPFVSQLTRGFHGETCGLSHSCWTCSFHIFRVGSRDVVHTLCKTFPSTTLPHAKLTVHPVLVFLPH
eukprot:g1053.t1